MDVRTNRLETATRHKLNGGPDSAKRSYIKALIEYTDNTPATSKRSVTSSKPRKEIKAGTSDYYIMKKRIKSLLTIYG